MVILIVIGSEWAGQGEVRMRDKDTCLRMAGNLRPVPLLTVYCVRKTTPIGTGESK